MLTDTEIWMSPNRNRTGEDLSYALITTLGGPSLQMPQPGPTQDKPQAHLSLMQPPCLSLRTAGACWEPGVAQCLEASDPVLLMGQVHARTPAAFRATLGLCWARLPQPCPLPGTEGLFLDGLRASDKDTFTKKAQTPKPNAVNKNTTS